MLNSATASIHTAQRRRALPPSTRLLLAPRAIAPRHRQRAGAHAASPLIRLRHLADIERADLPRHAEAPSMMPYAAGRQRSRARSAHQRRIRAAMKPVISGARSTILIEERVGDIADAGTIAR